jgi:hypothetical protein
MPNLTDLTSLSTGVIAAAAGTIAGVNMDLHYPAANILFALGFTGTTLGTFYAHPHFIPFEQNPYATVLGAVCETGLGLFLKYGVEAPNYVTSPVLLGVALATTWGAAYAADRAREGQECSTRVPSWLKSIFSVNIVRNTNTTHQYYIVEDCRVSVEDLQKTDVELADQGELSNLPENPRPALPSYQAVTANNVNISTVPYPAHNKL